MVRLWQQLLLLDMAHGLLFAKIHEVTGFRVKSTLKGIIGISIITAIMAVVTLVLYGLISLILMPLSPGHF